MGSARKRGRFLSFIQRIRGKRPGDSPLPAARLPVQRVVEAETAHTDELTPGVVEQSDLGVPWKAMIDCLGRKDRQRLKSYGITTGADDELEALHLHDVWTQLRQVVEQKQKDVVDRTWKIHFRGNTVILRDVIGSIASRLQSVKDVGGAIADLLPAQAALPWAIIKFLIQSPVARFTRYSSLMRARFKREMPQPGAYERFRESQSSHIRALANVTEGRMSMSQESSSNFCDMMEAEEQSQILQWASQIRYLEDRHIAKRGISDNTGTWMLQNNSYKTWKESQESEILWLRGISLSLPIAYLYEEADHLCQSICNRVLPMTVNTMPH
ncbi:1-alkyl-2-acetylglycerophosphocholine esterase [Apiospora marii]|uniref:1-alkyl-2-acetylglycerophosphocholine esterase n=1 Tax=Apiospora marii TaxID=335849 RepID=A0ABR1RHW9_9PEZI